MKVFGQLEKAQLENTTSDTAGHPKGMATYRTDINQVKVSNGTAYKTMIDEDSTQSMSNKTLASPTVTGAATLEQQGSTPSTPSAGFNKMYFKTDGKPYYVDSAGTEVPFGSGSGSGVKNYIENGDAELTSPLPSTYADAVQSRPVDGTGGSPTITFTRTLASPLAGDASWLFTHPGSSSYQGEGVSFDFTIDPIDQAKVLQIRFGYEIASGTYSGGTSSTDSDLIAYIYDVTNAVMIEPSVIKLDGGVSGVKYQYRGEFQTASNSTSYRLILHKATTNTSAFTMKIDDIEVTPNVVSRGAVITEWFDYTPTAGLTGATWSGKWRRVGDCMELQIYGVWGGAAGGTNLTLSIPSGYAVDTAKIPTAMFLSAVDGLATLNDVSGGAYYDIRLGLNGDGVFASFDSGTLGQYNGVSPTAPFTIASGDRFTGTFRVPIQGWGTSQTLSQDGGTRVVAARAFRASTNQTVSTTSPTDVVFNSTTFDTHRAFNTTTGIYTVPEAGYYRVTGSVYLTNLTAGEAYTLSLRTATASFASRFFRTSATDLIESVTGIVKLDAGQTISARVNSSADTSYTIIANSTTTYLEIEKIQGPQQIAATETVAFIGTVSNQTIITGTLDTAKIVIPGVEKDTHGAFNNTTGEYTVPAPGLYSISHSNALAGYSTTTTLRVGITLDSTSSFYKLNSMDTSSGHLLNPATHVLAYLRAGQVIRFAVSHANITDTALINDSRLQVYSIHRVGI